MAPTKQSPPPRMRRAAPAQAVRVPKAAELIADALRRRIVRGELREGDSLASEADLIAEYQVSRASLREALRVLEAESLITVKRGARGGARISMPREETAAKSISLLLQLRGAQLKDIFGARLIIEPPLVGQLAHTRTQADLDALNRHLELERRAMEDFQAFAPLAADMHRLLMRLSGNVVLTLVVGMIDELYMRHLTRFIARRRPDQLTLNKGTLANHRELVKRIQDKDDGGAEVMWRYHILQARKYILDELGEDASLAQI